MVIVAAAALVSVGCTKAPSREGFLFRSVTDWLPAGAPAVPVVLLPPEPALPDVPAVPPSPVADDVPQAAAASDDNEARAMDRRAFMAATSKR